jgi:putative ABC transport system permease protein
MNTLWLAWRYVTHHRVRTAILVLSLVIIALLPAAVAVLTRVFERELIDRSVRTPMLVGRKGSRYDLTLSALYFEGRPIETIGAKEAARVEESGLARAIPLLVRHRARRAPVVGTTLDYFDHRRLRLARGTMMLRLGDCVLGWRVARRLALGPSDSLMTDSTNVFDIAGDYPLKMRVTGVLSRSHSVDDDAIFCDLKTAWVIEGIGHGHEDVARAEPSQLLKSSDNQIVASAGVVSHTEITDANVGSFHFHGNPATFPLSAVIAIPCDEKSATLLAGRYLGPDETCQILRPTEVVRELFDLVFRIKRFFDLQAGLVAVSTTLLVGLIMLLSARLREREMRTLYKVGCGRWTIVKLYLVEWSIILGLAALVVAGVLAGIVRFADHGLRTALF